MSFADELRQAPDQKQRDIEARRRAEEEREKRAKLQQKQDWNRFISQCYESIKKKCKSQAYNSSTSCSFSLDEFIPARSKDFDEDGEPIAKDYNSWEIRIEDRTWYRLKPQRPYKKCLSKEDLTTLTETLKQLLEADGLTVNIAVEDVQKYKYEQQFIRRPDSERKFNRVFNTLFDLDHDDEGEGEYKQVVVKDGFRYKFRLTVSWT